MSALEFIRQQRRKYPRTPIKALCDIFAPDMNRIMGKGYLLNFSRGGLRVLTCVPIGRGRPVGINVEGLGQTKWITARVANVRQVTDQTYSCGLRFEELGFLEKSLVDRRLRRLARLRAA